VMFRSSARLLRFRPENGMQVVLRGRVTIYEDRGELQISAEYLEPKGAGALQVAFEQLKAKLEAEGLFDSSRKKPIPTLPRRIGIVTSPQAAALRDVLNILRRRHHTANVLIYPAQVQGDAAALEVSAGIRYFNRTSSVDVVIVARGGGSAEDLAAFNHEGLARTIASSRVPVISAIGHETDFTIVDFVADLRAPTPSAAAELVIRSRQEIEQQAEQLRKRLAQIMRYRLLMYRQALTDLAQHAAFLRIADALNRRQQRLDDWKYRLEKAERQILERHRRRWEVAAAAVRHYDVRRMLAGIRRELNASLTALAAGVRALFMQKQSRLDQISGRLQALSPLAILDRGYALVFDSSGRLVKDCEQIQVGEEISARLAKGTFSASVTKRSTE
jgi:exodeoxyribonuclease VII large subunit